MCPDPVTPPPSETRLHPRVPIGFRVKIVTEDHLITFGSACNLSEGGILLRFTPELAPGRECGIAIFLLDQEVGERIIARGRVTRSDASGTALQFTRPLDGTSHRLLATLLLSQRPPEGSHD